MRFGGKIRQQKALSLTGRQKATVFWKFSKSRAVNSLASRPQRKIVLGMPERIGRLRELERAVEDRGQQPPCFRVAV